MYFSIFFTKTKLPEKSAWFTSYFSPPVSIPSAYFSSLMLLVGHTKDYDFKD